MLQFVSENILWLYHGMNGVIRTAVIGTGAIGRYLAHAIQEGRAGAVRLVALADTLQMQARLENAALHHGCAWSTDVLRLPDYEPDIVVEAAAPQVVRQYAIPLLDRGVDVLVMSAGALSDSAFLLELEQALQRSRRRLYVPSGAIGGLDVLRAAALDGLEELRLTTSKPPAALFGAPWFSEHPVDLDGIVAPTVLFRGSVADAVRWFPQNVNVAAILNLTAPGMPAMTVEVVADPTLRRNLHEIYARGTFGEMTLRVANLPSPNNPKTSHLACLSPIALLRRLSAGLVVGS
jgi:aspartate dehydrogenase